MIFISVLSTATSNKNVQTRYSHGEIERMADEQREPALGILN